LGKDKKQCVAAPIINVSTLYLSHKKVNTVYSGTLQTLNPLWSTVRFSIIQFESPSSRGPSLSSTRERADQFFWFESLKPSSVHMRNKNAFEIFVDINEKSFKI